MTDQRRHVVYMLLLVLSVYKMKADELKRLEKKVRILEAKVYHDNSALREDLDSVKETLNNTEHDCQGQRTGSRAKCSSKEITKHRPSSDSVALESEWTNVVGAVKRGFGSEKARMAEHIKGVEGDMKILNGTLNAGVNWLGKKLDDVQLGMISPIQSIERTVTSLVSDVLLLKQTANTANEEANAGKIACNKNVNANTFQMERIFIILNGVLKLVKEQAANSRLLSRFALKQWSIPGFASSHYFVLYEKQNWPDAMRTCESFGAYLAEVNSEAEQTYLAEMIGADEALSTTDRLWLGSNDLDCEGVWKWVNSNTVLTFTYWRTESNEPNGYTRENCLLMYTYRFKYKWNDSKCSNAFRAICEFSG